MSEPVLKFLCSQAALKTTLFFFNLVHSRSRHQNRFDEQGIHWGKCESALQPNLGVDLKDSRKGKVLLWAMSSKPIFLHYVEGKVKIYTSSWAIVNYLTRS